MTPKRTRFQRAMDALGIHIRPGAKWRVDLRPRFFAVFGVLGLIAILASAGMTKYSTSPGFCKSCHIMKPYYEAWKNSKHKDVACVKCHYPPGTAGEILYHKFQALSQVAKYVTRTYSSKPYAEVEDASCLRSGCHSKRLLEGKLVTERGIRFDHRPHLAERRRGRQLKCVSCHSQMVMGKHVEVTYDTCFLCHFKNRGTGRDLNPLGGCRGCHELPTKTFAIGNMKYNHKDFVTKRDVSCRNCHIDVLYGEGEATQDRCFTCHNQPEKLKKIDDIPFIHDNHVTKHNVACFHCHKEIRHGFVKDDGSRLARLHEDEEPRKTPGRHVPSLKFECSYCHESTHGGQLEMYSGKVASLGLTDMPSPMYSAEVDCVGCHFQKENDRAGNGLNGKTYFPSKESCVKCHGKSFNGIWEETKTALGASLKKLAGKLAAARKAADEATLPPKEKTVVEMKLAKVKEWHEFVRAARGEHNIYLAADILRKESATLDEVGKKLGKPLPEVADDPLVSGAFCATMCHAKVGVKVPAEKMKIRVKDAPAAVKGKLMPHKMHSEMTGGCVKCHEIGTHKVVKLKKNLGQAVCAECHQ